MRVKDRPRILAYALKEIADYETGPNRTSPTNATRAKAAPDAALPRMQGWRTRPGRSGSSPA